MKNTVILILLMLSLGVSAQRKSKRKKNIPATIEQKIPEHLGVTGSVKYHKNIQHDSLKPRDIIVWLPESYSSDSSQRYPVLYMHDGQNIIDPKTSHTSYDWHIDEVADSLIRNNIINPIIIVGIYNTTDRGKEYMGALSTYYADLVINTIKPLIDSTYRTLPDKENTATGGSSAGGYVSFTLTWENPDVFTKAICMSPAFHDSLGMGLSNYTHQIKPSDSLKTNLSFYFDMGGTDIDQVLRPGLNLVLKKLIGMGYNKQNDFFVVVDQNASHTEKAWHARLPYALTVLFAKTEY